jgi:undecaprenyl-diphosphatase
MRARIGIYSVAAALLVAATILAGLRVAEEPGALSGWQALVLGIVQGLTELLPISSSGHLILVPWLADWRYLETHNDFNQTFDVALHFGTLVAVVAYFRTDIARLVAAWLGSIRRRRVETSDERLAWVVAIATVPAAVVGAAGESLIADKLGDPWQIAIFLAFFGVVLWIADRRPQARGLGDVRYGEALALGFAQALALMPGVSRSGITISAARFLGLDRDAAARLSFLLLVPIVLGAVLLKGVTDVLLGDLPAGWGGPFLVGTLAAAGAGLVAIDLLLGYVRRHDYSLFVLYRLAVAVFIAGLILTGVRDASF